jgi:hypothetical protein
MPLDFRWTWEVAVHQVNEEDEQGAWSRAHGAGRMEQGAWSRAHGTRRSEEPFHYP